MELLLGVTVILLIGTLTAGKSCSRHWEYMGDCGPSRWPDIALTCGGTRQSPINIDTDSVEVQDWQPFTFENYDAPPDGILLRNNGLTAKLDISARDAPKIRQGGLNGDYILSSLIFHWGSDSAQGSEHTIDNVSYPMEMKIVSYKAAYGGLGQAISRPDGLAILSVMFEVGKTDNPVFTPIVEALASITEAGMKVDLLQPYSPLRAFLPDDTEKFYRYEGSITTPTCNEAVIWTVFDKTVKISEKQLNAFRALKNEDGHKIVNNYRPTQPLHNRKVFVCDAIPRSSNSMEMMIFAVFFLATAAVAVIVKIL